METIRVEVIRAGVNLIAYSETEEKNVATPLEQDCVMEFTDSRKFTYNGASLDIGHNPGYKNILWINYKAPISDSFALTASVNAPRAHLSYHLGHPEFSSAEFGKPDALIRVSFLGHELREVAAPLFESNLSENPLEYQDKYQRPHLLIPICPVIHSHHLYNLENHQVAKEGFAGQARFYAELEPAYHGEEVRKLTIAFATKDGIGGLTRIKEKEIIGESSYDQMSFVKLSQLYSTRLAEIGGFLQILADVPEYYPRLERGFNLELLELFAKPDMYDDSRSSVWRSDIPYYKRNKAASNFMYYEDIDWEQVLKDIPDISETAANLNRLIHAHRFSMTTQPVAS